MQGLGAALVSPAALSIVTTTFAEGRERTQALGIWSAIAAGGGAVGLVIGGWLTQDFSWRWVFFINLPIGIITFAARLPLHRELAGRAAAGHGRHRRARPPSRAGCSCSSTTSSRRSSTAGRPAARSGCSSSPLALLAAFVVIESRSKAPLIRLGIFRVRSLTSANLAMLFVIAGLYGMFFFATIYVQEVLGWKPLKAGLGFVPVTVGIVIGAALSQQLIRRLGARLVPIIGIALAASGLVLLSRIPLHGTYLADLFPGLFIMSIGMGLTFVPITLIATTGIDVVGRRPRLGALQHLAAGGRGARARGPLVDRGEPDEPRARGDACGGARRRLPARVPRRRRADGVRRGRSSSC